MLLKGRYFENYMYYVYHEKIRLLVPTKRLLFYNSHLHSQDLIKLLNSTENPHVELVYVDSCVSSILVLLLLYQY